ncbi:MAG: AMP-binding protein, partial [Nitrospiria bacterium]
PPARALTLDSSLERDAGLDSLGRVELVLRIEQRFGVRLAEALMASAETPRDLLRGVLAREDQAAPAAALESIEAGGTAIDGSPDGARTLVEALRWHLARHPDRPHVYLLDDQGGREALTYGALWAEAAAVAGGLRARGVGAGQAVAIMLPTSRDYFTGFTGILLAGGIPVPLYPPLRLAQIEDHVTRQTAILRNAAAAVMITVPEAKRLGRLLRTHVESLRHVLTIDDLRAPEDDLPSVGAQDLALLQYTSGSTGTPKGVMLTHANLLANIRAMGQAVRATSEDVLVSWLPLYHDMGLIGAWLGSLYHAAPLVLMSPLSFLARPERWLKAIQTHRGTISAGPNFAFELCVRKISDEALAGLDLSSWRLAVNGAEPINPDTLARFIERFGPYGFRPETMAPVYGLAEASVGLAFPPLGRPPLIDRIDRTRFHAEGRAIPASPGDPAAMRVVACGRPLPEHQIRVADERGREAAEREVGRVEFQGPSATSGYYRNPEATRALFHGAWLDSGDLGYMAGGDLYLTGRAKELIIRAGRNLYPYELEDAVGAVPGIRKGCVAVFASGDHGAGTERLIVAAETRETDPARREALRERIRALALAVIQTAPDDVVLVPPHAVLKTSSGKIRRAACRDLYERGALGADRRAVWVQVGRMAAAGAGARALRGLRDAANALYAGYVWMAFALGFAAAGACAAALPDLRARQRAIRAIARAAFAAAGIPLMARGVDRVARGGPFVYAINHASYLDAPALIAVLPPGISFVAKRELANVRIARWFLHRLGTRLVERFNAAQGADDLEGLVAAVVEGQSVAVFPEGTFGRAPGIRPFRLGAFSVACRTGRPVVPVVIRGTRSILRDGSWFPRRGTITVTVGEPRAPDGADWSSALALRDAVRAKIVEGSGEPDLQRLSGAVFHPGDGEG